MGMVTKEIKGIPWPGPKFDTSLQPFFVTANMPVVDGERMLLVTFQGNPMFDNKRVWERDIERIRNTNFRILISKKQSDFRIIDKAGSVSMGGTSLLKMWGHGETPYNMYPMISEQDEKRIRMFCGDQETKNHQLDNMWALAVRLREEKKVRESVARGEIQNDEVYDCPDEPPEGFLEWAKNKADKEKIILYKKGNRRGRCYYCKKEVTAVQGQRFCQNAYIRCPNCGTKVDCVLEDGQAWKAYKVGCVASFQKSADGTLWIRLWNLNRSSTAEYGDIRKFLWEHSRYAIRGGKTKRWTCMDRYREGWSCYSRVIQVPLKDWKTEKGWIDVDAYYTANLKECVAGTSLQYMCLPEYIASRRGYPVKYAIDAAGCPVMEFLYKGGYKKLLDEKVSGGCYPAGRPVINWKKKSLKDCFKFPVQWLKAMDPAEWSSEALERCNELYKNRETASEEEVWFVAAVGGWKLLNAVTKYTTSEKMIRYLRKQAKADDKKDKEQVGRIRSKGGGYRDYVQECEKLGLDMNDKAVLFPPDLDRAHARTAAEVKYQQDRKQQEMFNDRVRNLRKMSWNWNGLLIRPAEGLEELIIEGSALMHCVAGYADRMARGETAIFLIRKEADPDTPFFTLELQGKTIVQCRTLKNKSYTAEGNEDIEVFVREWMKKVVLKNSSRKEKKGDAAAGAA